jgi:hypothetical protein
MTLQQLKSEAYDILAQIEFLQLKLREKNEEIRKESQQPAPVDADIVS